jgi:uncharacterized protein
VTVALLDVNTLVALFWPRHVLHDVASRWFQANRASGWATCTLTQAGFVRMFAQPAVTHTNMRLSDALEILESNLSEKDHVFWLHDTAIPRLSQEIRERLRGPNQLNDAILLDLAIRRRGRLATFDLRVQNLLPPDSPHHAAIEIIV